MPNEVAKIRPFFEAEFFASGRQRGSRIVKARDTESGIALDVDGAARQTARVFLDTAQAREFHSALGKVIRKREKAGV